MLSGYINSLEKYLEGPGKVLEFMVSNIVGTVDLANAKSIVGEIHSVSENANDESNVTSI